MSAADFLCRVHDRNLTLEGALDGSAEWLDLDDLKQANLIEDAARFTGTGIATIDLVLPQREEVGAVVLSGVTTALDALVRTSFFADAARTTLLPGAPAPAWRRAWGRVHDTTALRWSAPNAWRGGPSERDMRGKRRHIIVLPPAQLRPRAVRIEVDNHGEPWDAGYLYVAAAEVPEWGYAWGRKVEPVWGSKVDVTPGGGRIVMAGQARRVQSFEFADLTSAEAVWFANMSFINDQAEPVLVVPEPNIGPRLWWDLCVGFLRSVTAVQQDQGDLWKGTLQIEEMAG